MDKFFKAWFVLTLVIGIAVVALAQVHVDEYRGTVTLKSGTTTLATFDTGGLTMPVSADGFWSIQSSANQACNTTCTAGACVFGVNTASATADITTCADATADECLCAGN